MKKVLFLFLFPVFLFTNCQKEDATIIDVPSNEEAVPFITKPVDYDDDSTPKAIFTIGNKDQELLEQESLLLNNVPDDAISYYWEFGNGDYSTEANPNYKYKIHGYYTVSLTMVDKEGNLKKSSEEVLVLCLFGGGKHDQ